jgi:hypothetical protein
MTAATISLVEKVARAIADVQREAEGKQPFTDAEWGEDFWLWYQRYKDDPRSRIAEESWPAKLERQGQAALAACEFEATRGILTRLTAPYTGDPDAEPLERIIEDARALLARLDGKAT